MRVFTTNKFDKRNVLQQSCGLLHFGVVVVVLSDAGSFTSYPGGTFLQGRDTINERAATNSRFQQAVKKNTNE